MQRREFIMLLVGVAAWPIAAQAQAGYPDHPITLASRRELRKRGHPRCAPLFLWLRRYDAASAINAGFYGQSAALSSVTFSAYIPDAGATRLWR